MTIDDENEINLEALIEQGLQQIARFAELCVQQALIDLSQNPALYTPVNGTVRTVNSNESLEFDIHLSAQFSTAKITKLSSKKIWRFYSTLNNNSVASITVVGDFESMKQHSYTITNITSGDFRLEGELECKNGKVQHIHPSTQESMFREKILRDISKMFTGSKFDNEFDSKNSGRQKRNLSQSLHYSNFLMHPQAHFPDSLPNLKIVVNRLITEAEAQELLDLLPLHPQKESQPLTTAFFSIEQSKKSKSSINPEGICLREDSEFDGIDGIKVTTYYRIIPIYEFSPNDNSNQLTFGKFQMAPKLGYCVVRELYDPDQDEFTWHYATEFDFTLGQNLLKKLRSIKIT